MGARDHVRFTIAGEPEVGGLVEEADVEGDGGAASNETLSECLRETVMSLQFAPPRGGGVATVTYPFVFQPSEEDEGTP